MMFILSITPLILGILVVILSLIRKLKPQAVIETVEEPLDKESEPVLELKPRVPSRT